MNVRNLPRLLLSFCAVWMILQMASPGLRGEVREITEMVSLEVGEIRSTLDRLTGRVETTANLNVSNTSDRPVETPLHVVFRFSGEEALLESALGGPGVDPYGTYYLDLSPDLPEGLLPGEEIVVPFLYSRPGSAPGSYTLEVYGRVNRDPLAVAAVPDIEVAGVPLSFDASGSFDPDGGELVYLWDFGDGATSEEIAPNHFYALPGVYTVRLRVVDPQGAADELLRTIRILPEGDFSLARVRTLDGDGQPLPGVTVTEVSGDGALSFVSDGAGLFISSGEGSGQIWQFSKAGYLPVWRAVEYADRSVVLVPSPWLAKTPGQEVVVSPLLSVNIGAMSDPAVLSFPAGAFGQPGPLRYTALDGQTLPLPLPRGWSPLAAFHFATSDEILEPGVVSWQTPRVSEAGEVMAVLRFDPSVPQWTVAELPPSGSLPATHVAFPGTWALVVADSGATGPSLPEVGEALAGGDAGEGGDIVAEGEFDPPIRVASLDPAAVTTTGRVFFEADGPVASGRLFRAAVSERYALLDGSGLRTPDYDTTLFAYRDQAERAPNRLRAEFAFRPSLLFSSGELAEARLFATILDAEAFTGAILDAQGGVLATDFVTLAVPPGAFDRRIVAELRDIDAEGFAALLQGLAAARAFQLIAPETLAPIPVVLSALSPSTDFVLARLISAGGRQGLEPVLRMRSDAHGMARSTEPAMGPRLPGLIGGGRYVLVEVEARPGLVTGVARALEGTTAPGLVIGIVGQPWKALTRSGGFFTIVALVGEGTAEAVDPFDANRGTTNFELLSDLDVAVVEIQILPTGPRVIEVVPADGATNVNTVSPIRITFSEPIDTASFGPEAFELAVAADDALVPGSLGLNAAATVATFLPTNPLAAATDYVIRLSPDIRDPGGLPIEGKLEFTFRTAAAPARGLGAELVIYEPGAENVPVEVLSQLVGYAAGAGSSHVIATGGPGTADPEVPVILVNESTGETATVLSKPDGTFATFINADEGDFVTAVFVNANETRVSIPATRQIFDDGRVGLYRQGGILEAESDGLAVRVLIEPEAIETRTRHFLKPINLGEFMALVRGVEPIGGKVIGAIGYAEQLEGISTAAHLSMDVREDQLGLPAGTDPAEATFALAIPRDIGGNVVYDIVDKMVYADGPEGEGRLETASPPFMGLLLRQLAKLREGTPYVDRFQQQRRDTVSLETPSLKQFGPAGTLIETFAVILIAAGPNVVISGEVTRRTEAEEPHEGDPLPGALVSLFNPLLSPPPGTSDALNILAGPFMDGQTIATSRANGTYALLTSAITVGFGVRVEARHPRFPFQHPASPATYLNPGAVTVMFADLEFISPVGGGDLPDRSDPFLTVSHSPPFPSSGGTATVRVVGIDDVAVAGAGVEVVAYKALFVDESLGTENVTLEFVSSAQPSPARLLQAWTVSAPDPGIVSLRVLITDTSGNEREALHNVAFGLPEVAADEGPPRRLAFHWPPEGATGIPRDTPLFLSFSRSLPPEAVTGAGAFSWLSLSDGFNILGVEVSDDLREVTVRYTDAGTGDADEMTISINSTVIDQFPGLSGEEGEPDTEGGGYSFSFSFAPSTGASLPAGIPSGGGIVAHGRFAYALSRDSAEAGKLVALDLGDPANPVSAGEYNIEGRPMDLALIPSYALARNAQPDGTSIHPVKSYIAVFSGVPIGFKFIYLFEILPNGSLVQVYRSAISREISQITKTKWDPPFLGFLEISASTNHQLHLMDLNAFAIAKDLTAEDMRALAGNPATGVPGLDLDGNGDYAGPNDRNPVPARDARFLGQAFSWAPLDVGERIEDFDFNASFGLLGLVYRSEAGHGMRMVLGGGVGELMPDSAVLTFPEDDPRRIRFLPATVVIGEDGEKQLMDLALVSTGFGSNGSGNLLVVDISDPSLPVLLARLSLPPNLGGAGSIVQRNDGTLAMAMMGGSVLLMRPERLLLDDQGQPALGDFATGAVVAMIEGMGSGIRSFVDDFAGISAVNGGGSQRLRFGGPRFSLVHFPDRPPVPVRSPESGPPDIFSLGDQARRSWLREARQVDLAEPLIVNPAAEPLPPPDPDRHYYVLVEIPGGAVGGASIQLVAQALGPGGRPILPGIRNSLPTILADESFVLKTALLTIGKYAALRKGEDFLLWVSQVSELAKDLRAGLGSYPKTLVAHRLSDDPGSDLYNTFAAGPLVLLPVPPDRNTEPDLPLEESLANLQEQLPRAYLRASPYFWVGLSPVAAGGESSAIAGFRSKSSDALASIEVNWLNVLAGFVTGGVESAAMALFDEIIKPLKESNLDTFFLPGAHHLQGVAFRRNPVVFVPGVSASRLRAEDDEELWPSLLALTAEGRARLEKMVASADTPVPLDAPGALLSVGPKDVQGEFLRQIAIGAGLETYDPAGRRDAHRLSGNPNWLSLVRQPELFIFPYDWRMDNRENAVRLSAYLDLIQTVIPDATKVDIIAHSMGGIVSRRMLLDGTNASRVDRLITVASPLLGAPKAMAAMRTGDFDELGMNIMLPPDIMRRAARRAPALHQLLPNHGYYALGSRPLVEAGWDANLNNIPFETLDYNGYRTVMDGAFFDDPEDPDSVPPISGANENLFGATEGLGEMIDWRTGTESVRYFHIVAAQKKSLTIHRLSLTPTLSPATDEVDFGLHLAGVSFSEPNRFGVAQPRPIADGEPLDLTRTFVLDYGFRIARGMGDGTVPILSQTRGFGVEGGSFNHAEAIVLPIVSASPANTDDEHTSHVGVLGNPILWKAVGRILDGAPVRQPTLAISVTAENGFFEGELIEFEVDITGDVGEGPHRVVWDTGDGGRAIGTEGSNVYRDDGAFTLTCLVSYASGEGAVASKTVNIANRPPEFSVVVRPAHAAPGETITFLAVPDRREVEETITYEWDFGDGRKLPATPASLVTHSYLRPGSETVRVTARDQSGGVVEKEVATTVSVQPPAAPMASLSGGEYASSGLLVDEAATDFVTVVVVGHDVASGSPKVFADGTEEGSGLLERIDAGVRSYIGLAVENLSADAVSVKVPRLSGGLSVPNKSRITIKPVREIISLRAYYNREDGFLRCFEFEVAVGDATEVSLELDWERLFDIEGEEQLRAMTTPTAVAAGIIACSDTRPPEPDTFDDEPTVPNFRLVARDTREDVELTETSTFEDITVVSGVAVVDDKTEEDPVDGSTRTQPSRGSLVTYASGEAVPAGSVPAGSSIFANDAAGNARIITERVQEAPRAVLSEELAETLRAETFAVVNEANGYDIFKSMVLDYGDVWVFEQGSGASLWRGNLRKAVQAFNPATSDRDFELFLPAMKTGFTVYRGEGENRAIDYSEEADLTEFRRMAHYGDVMEGDWYFKRPHGVTASGRDLGPPPDPTDRVAYERFLAAVASWRYVLPETPDSSDAPDLVPVGTAVVNTYTVVVDIAEVEGLPGVFLPRETTYRALADIPKGHLFGGEVPHERTGKITSVFAQPATPAEVIAFILTERARAEVGDRRELLPEVSFFPFRREHFLSGVMSLEKPPPFGDDPLGDAGMGRHLLLLKWVLEGAFLPAFGEFNKGIDDEAIRSAAHTALMSRIDEIFLAEGYEWALYQEFAMLDAHILLRARPAAGETGAVPAPTFADYLRKHDMKMLKKGGKAALRAILARAAINEQARNEIQAMTPSTYTETDHYTTFEHWVVDLANANVSASAGFDADELDNLLRAKVGDDHFLVERAESSESVDSDLRRVFKAFSEDFQPSTRQTFVDYVDGLMERGLPAEYRLRKENLDAIQYGFTKLDGGFRAGRRVMLGLESAVPTHNMTYTFSPIVARRGRETAEVGPFSVSMVGGGSTLTYEEIRIPENKSFVELKPGNTDDKPAFKSALPINETGSINYRFSMDGEVPDLNPRNNEQDIELYYFDPGTPYAGLTYPEVRDSVFLYRGITISLDQVVVPGVLQERVRALSPARRNHLATLPPDHGLSEEELEGVLENADDSVSLDMIAILEGKYAIDPDVRPGWFSKGDVEQMNLREKAALAHTLNEISKGGLPSSCISLSRFPGYINQFYDPGENETREGFLIVYELPREHPRLLRYLSTELRIEGQPVKREVNQEEWEVVAYGKVPFRRAWIFQREDPTSFEWGSGWFLVESFTGEENP